MKLAPYLTLPPGTLPRALEGVFTPSETAPSGGHSSRGTNTPKMVLQRKAAFDRQPSRHQERVYFYKQSAKLHVVKADKEITGLIPSDFSPQYTTSMQCMTLD